eukprot:TRINITY_DN7592_c0_g1_i1.p1 TRINITY_DN7592_c0_g1~~TRINITY_DN7592_c0_g1_i1.p1  ORF type:complete len:207 (+),score=38.20 TRINITY_DN7592_c0_g1_i1:91-711(+)
MNESHSEGNGQLHGLEAKFNQLFRLIETMNNSRNSELLRLEQRMDGMERKLDNVLAILHGGVSPSSIAPFPTRVQENAPSEGGFLWSQSFPVFETKEGKSKEKVKVSKIKVASQKRDPSAPKRAKTAWIIYSNDKRYEIKQKNPDATLPRIMELVSMAWKEIGADEKKIYEEKAMEEKRRYAKEYAEYQKKKEEEGEEYEEFQEDD